MDLVAAKRVQTSRGCASCPIAMGCSNHSAFVVWHVVRGQTTAHEGVPHCDAVRQSIDAEPRLCATAHAGLGYSAEVSSFAHTKSVYTAVNFQRRRYIVTNPDRNILSRQELDAFLATAFSPHIVNIEYLQELVVRIDHFAFKNNIFI